jgi:hypothetical protein
MPLTNKLWKLQDKKPKYSTGNVLNAVVDSDFTEEHSEWRNGKIVDMVILIDDYFN